MKQNKKELFAFFAITFGWSWLINLPRVLENFGFLTIPPLVSTLMGYIAVFGPGVAAFWLISRAKGKEGRKELWMRGWKFKGKKIWWIPTLLLMPVSGVLTALAMKIGNIPLQMEYSLPPAMIVPIGLLIWLLGALPEEYGWRGYAQGRLQKQFNPLVTSLILGSVWALWHLPLHFIEGTTQYYIPIHEYFLQTVVLAFLYTWLYNHTKGSVLIAGAFHAIGNLTGAIIPYWTVSWGRWISFGLLLLTTIIIVVVELPAWTTRQTESSAAQME